MARPASRAKAKAKTKPKARTKVKVKPAAKAAKPKAKAKAKAKVAAKAKAKPAVKAKPAAKAKVAAKAKARPSAPRAAKPAAPRPRPTPPPPPAPVTEAVDARDIVEVVVLAEPADATVIPASPIETEVAALLADYAAGDIDNAWDVLPRMGELTTLLPHSSALRADFDRMFAEIVAIAQEIS